MRASRVRVVLVAVGGRSVRGRPSCSQDSNLLFTYTCEAGFSPTRTAASRGRTPAAVSRRTSSFSSAKIWSRILVPSRMRAVIPGSLSSPKRKQHHDDSTEMRAGFGGDAEKGWSRRNDGGYTPPSMHEVEKKGVAK